MLNTITMFVIRHAGNLSKTQVLFLAAFGALYAFRVDVLISLVVAASYAVVLILLFTFSGERALKGAAFVGCCGVMFIDAVYYVTRDISEYIPATASIFGAIGYSAVLIPVRQVSILEFVDLSKSPDSENNS